MIDQSKILSMLQSTMADSQKMQQSMQEAILAQAAGSSAKAVPGTGMGSSLTGLFDQLNSHLKEVLATMDGDLAKPADKNEET
ncbi:MAG TPA: hypothetical protein VIM98_16170 [Dyella sp.]|uniref:hypothetical protein n=1 Tax=Dyella sp. TaxID=1869338 RepID=UPI002F956718